jgi:hypothetical protein
VCPHDKKLNIKADFNGKGESSLNEVQNYEIKIINPSIKKRLISELKYYIDHINKIKKDLEDIMTISNVYQKELIKINNQIDNKDDDIEKKDFKSIDVNLNKNNTKTDNIKIENPKNVKLISNKTISTNSIKKNNTSFIERKIEKPKIVIGFIDKLSLPNLKADPNDKKMNLRTKKMILM